MPKTLIAQLSDPHLRLEDAASPAALSAAVERVLALKPLPDAVLLTGDIANTGDQREYALARALLAPLPMPVHWLPGNHDRFDIGARYTVDAGGMRVVMCDTTIAGRDDGTLDLDWLAAQLTEDVPTLVAMHHPPLVTGIAWLDAIGLPAADREALAALLRASPHVRAVTAGHVHRTIAAALGGCPVVTCTSTNVQSGLDFEVPDMVLTTEPPSILVHALLDSGDFVTHVQPV
ncbi:MAG TPA: metallophosphoesterase [Solirubrobacter sp.]|nr:metallophosphoesterase [Solirubrobacter sp.]